MSFSEFLNENQKQHINLSFSAWNIIENDIQCFYENSTENNLSNFLNRIFANYHEQSPATITNQLNEKRKFYLLSLKPKVKDPELLTKFEKFIDIFLENTEKELTDKLLNYPKGAGKKFRLTNDNYRYLKDFSVESKENQIFQRPGKYLKAIYETYAELPYVEREKIFYSETIEKISDAVEMGKIISVVLNNNKTIFLKPYKLTIDHLSNFNYLVGLTVPEITQYKHDQCTTLRISRIKSISISREHANITNIQMKAIEEQLTIKGVQFLVDETTEIFIKLSNIGIWKYNTQFNLRPQYVRIEPENIYVFNCTERQIEYYFFKFGKDATIITPKTLRHKFHSMYQEAEKNYCD
jgi:hypothetical protein